MIIKLVDYFDVLRKKEGPCLGSVLISKTDESFLIGPLITKDFCFVCFKKRIFSSEFVENISYRKNNKKDQQIIYKFIKKNGIRKNTIFEIYKNGTVEIHYLIKVPGCFH